jgi:hypothetical protein
VASLHSRDCSVQRRHQKIIEEGPALAAPRALLDDMERCARALARSVGYVGAATVEFLYCIEERRYYFLELNPRLQVPGGAGGGAGRAPLRRWGALLLGVCALGCGALPAAPGAGGSAVRLLLAAGGRGEELLGHRRHQRPWCRSPDAEPQPQPHQLPPAPPLLFRQVEHPVTEGITGVNIPACQLMVAMGVPLWRMPAIRVLFNRRAAGPTPRPLLQLPRPLWPCSG